MASVEEEMRSLLIESAAQKKNFDMRFKNLSKAFTEIQKDMTSSWLTEGHDVIMIDRRTWYDHGWCGHLFDLNGLFNWRNTECKFKLFIFKIIYGFY